MKPKVKRDWLVRCRYPRGNSCWYTIHKCATRAQARAMVAPYKDSLADGSCYYRELRVVHRDQLPKPTLKPWRLECLGRNGRWQYISAFTTDIKLENSEMVRAYPKARLRMRNRLTNECYPVGAMAEPCEIPL